jgi:restriction system protein
MDKCNQCGAPVENGKRTYCGAVYHQPAPQSNFSMPQQNFAQPPLPPPLPNQPFMNNTVNQVPYVMQGNNSRKVSAKSKGTALILAIFFGGLGLHHFYAGKAAMGVLYLLTFGLFFIGWFIDILIILSGNFKDSYGYYLV